MPSKSQHFSPGDKVFVRDSSGSLHIAEVKSQLRNTVWLKLHGREYGVQSHQLRHVPKIGNPGGRHLSCGSLSLEKCRKLQKIYETLREEKRYSKGRAASIAWATVQKMPNAGAKERLSRALGRKYDLLSDASPVAVTRYFQSIHEAQHKRSPTQGWTSPVAAQHRLVLLSEGSNRWYVYWVKFDKNGHPVGWTSDGPVSRVEARAIGIELFMKAGVTPNKALAIMTKFPEDAREERPRGHLRLVKNRGKRRNPDVDKVVARGQRYIQALEAYAEAVRDGRNTTAARKKMERAKSEFRDSLGAGVPLTIVASAIGATLGSLTFGTIGALVGAVAAGVVPSLIESVPDKGEEFDEDASHGSFRSMATTPRLSRLT